MNVSFEGREFNQVLSPVKVSRRVRELARTISQDYQDDSLTLVAILNGSFVFAADLIRAMSIPVRISFIKLSSYEGSQSTGTVETLIGLKDKLTGKHVLVLDDIIDTGLTIEKLLPQLKAQNPLSLKVGALLLKPEVFQKGFEVHYLGFEVENAFMIGYGLDIDGWGRNLKGVFQEV